MDYNAIPFIRYEVKLWEDKKFVESPIENES